MELWFQLLPHSVIYSSVFCKQSIFWVLYFCLLDLVPAAELPTSCLKSRSTWISRVAPFALTVSPTASLSSVPLTSLWVQLVCLLGFSICYTPNLSVHTMFNKISISHKTWHHLNITSGNVFSSVFIVVNTPLHLVFGSSEGVFTPLP